MARWDLVELAQPCGGKRVLITGGLGFIGSSLAHPLAQAGAKVTLVDAMIPGYGGNLFNVEPVRTRVRINFCDVRDPHARATRRARSPWLRFGDLAREHAALGGTYRAAIERVLEE